MGLNEIDLNRIDRRELYLSFFSWALMIDEVTRADVENHTLFAQRHGEGPEVAITLAPADWDQFVTWFENMYKGPPSEMVQQLFELLNTYLEQGLYQKKGVQSLALFDYGIWPVAWRE